MLHLNKFINHLTKSEGGCHKERIFFPPAKCSRFELTIRLNSTLTVLLLFLQAWQDADVPKSLMRKTHVLLLQAQKKKEKKKMSQFSFVSSPKYFFRCWTPEGHHHGKGTASCILKIFESNPAFYIYTLQMCHSRQKFTIGEGYHCARHKLD